MTSTNRLAALPVAALALAGALAACGHPASGHQHLARPANCSDKLHAWGSSGGRGDVHAIAKDTGKLSKDMPPVAAAFSNGKTSGSTKLAADGSRLSADAKAILAKPPPAWRTAARVMTTPAAGSLRPRSPACVSSAHL